MGRVSRLGRGRMSGNRYVMAGWVSDKGYNKVMLRGSGRNRQALVSNLVALAFLGDRPEGMDVLHDDGNSTNDRLSNLRYGTKVQNMADKLRHGTQPLGENSHLAKQDEATVRLVKEALAQNEKHVSIARRLGVSAKWISDVARGISWKHV